MAPAARSQSGYRYYSRGQTGAGRAIALLRSMDMPIADIRLGLRLAWRTIDGALAALASNEIEMLLLVPWREGSSPPPQSAYVYVEDPDSLHAEYQEAGAVIVDPVASRASGMRDFVVRDPDGHRFTFGCGEERLRDVAQYYGLTPEEISVDPEWVARRQQPQ